MSDRVETRIKRNEIAQLHLREKMSGANLSPLAESQRIQHDQIRFINIQTKALQKLALTRRKLNEDIKEFETELKDLKRTETKIKEREAVVQAMLEEAMEKSAANKLEMDNISRQIEFSENLMWDMEDDIRQYYLHY